MIKQGEAAFWNESVVVEYYENHRLSTEHVYPSEWHYLKELLREQMSVLDIGCALGGFAGVIAQRVCDFRYTGLDISKEMIRRAKQKHPVHRFYLIEEADLSVLNGETFDLVLCLGILHLSRKWRELISAAWHHTKEALLLDLRETYLKTCEDESISYFTMEAYSEKVPAINLRLPYNIINSTEAMETLVGCCPGFKSFRHSGYFHPVSKSAVTPIARVIMNTYCIEKASESDRESCLPSANTWTSPPP